MTAIKIFGCVLGIGLTAIGILARSYGRNHDGLSDNAGPVALAQHISTPLVAAGILLSALCVWGLVR